MDPRSGARAEPYTHAVWRVKRGSEDEFVARWEQIAAWAVENAPGCLWGVLLRDTGDPSVFVATGAWETPEDAEAFLETTERLEWMRSIRELVDEFEPRKMELVAVRDPEEWSFRARKR
jgi:quinol monooxygenase YgiN